MIYVLSGGSGKLFAAIGVTYPAGSNCECTDGKKKLKAKGTTNQALFAIPYAGKWTVRCFDGTDFETSANKASKTLDVAEGQSEKITLAYEVVLVNSSFSNSQKSSSSTTVNRNIKTAGTINLTGIKQLRLTVSAASVNGGSIRFFVNTSSLSDYSYNSSHPSTSAYVAITGKGEKTLDVSSLSGTYYYGISILTKADDASTTSAEISKIVGEYE